MKMTVHTPTGVCSDVAFGYYEELVLENEQTSGGNVNPNWSANDWSGV